MIKDKRREDMRTGILFYFNMGHITKIARIGALVLAAMLIFRTRFLSAFYPVYTAFFVVALFLSVIPAPSDKRFLNFLDRFYENVKQVAMDCCDLKRDNLVVLFRAFEHGGSIQLCRRYKHRFIYTTAAAAAFVEKSGKRFLVIGKKSLISAKPAKITVIDLNLEKEVKVSMQAGEDDYGMIRIEAPSLPNGIEMTAYIDYHYRDFLEAVKDYRV